MSTDSFIPSIWSASVLRSFEKASVFASAVSRDYSGELKGKGDVVKVPMIGPVAVRDYAQGTPITYDAVDGSTKDVTISEQKYFGLKADDVDQVQSAPAFLDAATANAGYALRDTVDQFVAETLTAGAGTKLYASAPYTLGDAGASGGAETTIKLFTELAMNLDQLNIPRRGRFLIIPPFVNAALSEAIIKAGMPNTTPLSEAFITRIAGFDVFLSNNLETDADENVTILGGVSAAATLIAQINKMEKLRDQGSFSDLVRGLMVYGSAVLLPEGLVTATVANPTAD